MATCLTVLLKIEYLFSGMFHSVKCRSLTWLHPHFPNECNCFSQEAVQTSLRTELFMASGLEPQQRSSGHSQASARVKLNIIFCLEIRRQQITLLIAVGEKWDSVATCSAPLARALCV
uniref:Uncharacterized protein n=1 Tax=Sphaerodactylus townsendi TaxID=933632 RepID=A0ACB8FZ09_9SAUR